MISEKSYLIILTAIFVAIAIILSLLLEPRGFVEYNLGINIITSSIFTAATIFLLSVLLTLRQDHEWKLVKNRMIETIRVNINDLFSYLLNLCEVPVDKRENALAELSKADKITLRNDISEYLSKDSYDLEGYIESLQDVPRTVRNIRVEYSRLMDPKLMSPLLVIEDRCRWLAFHLRMLKRIDFRSHKDIEEAYFQDLIASLVHGVMKRNPKNK